MQPTAYAIDPEALASVYTQAQAAYPDTERGWGRAIYRANNWLMELWLAGEPVLFDGDVMLVPSDSEEYTTHRVNGHCDCQAGERAAARGERGICWHWSARQLATKMLVRVAYIAEAQTVADAISSLDEAGAEYDAADVRARAAALSTRIAAARAAVATVERRTSAYREASELFA